MQLTAARTDGIACVRLLQGRAARGAEQLRGEFWCLSSVPRAVLGAVLVWVASGHGHVHRFPSCAYAEGPAWAQNAPKTSPGARNECQAGLGSSEREQMNQMQNGEIKPRRALKTTRLCELPAAVQGAPADAARRDSEPSGDFSAPPGRIVWLPAPEGKFHPSSRGLGCRVGERNPICFQSGSSLPCTARSSSPRCERPAGAPLRLFFFPLLQMHVAFCAPRPLLQAVPQPAAQPRIP